MGYGEKTMRTWGFTSSSMCIVLGVFTLALAILTIVVLRGDVSVVTRDNTVTYAIIVIVLSLAATVVGGFGVYKIYKSNEIYLKVSTEAALGKIKVRSQTQSSPNIHPAAIPAPKPNYSSGNIAGVVQNNNNTKKLQPTPTQDLDDFI